MGLFGKGSAKSIATGAAIGAVTPIGAGTGALLGGIDSATGGQIQKELKHAAGLDAPGYSAPGIKAPPQVTAPTMAPGSKAATVAAPGSLQGATIGQTADPRAVLINGAPQGQFRAQQMTLAQQLAATASGQGPSAAAEQLRQGTEANIAAQMAASRSARGPNAGLAARGVAMGAADARQQMAGQAALARIQEQTAAQQSLGSVLAQGRGTDVELASQQAQLQQQAALAKYQGDLQKAVEQGRLDQSTAEQMFQAQNQKSQQDAQLAQQFAALQQQYAAMGLSAQQANQMAAIEIEKVKQGQSQFQYGASQEGAKARQALFGGLLSAGGQAGAAMVGKA